MDLEKPKFSLGKVSHTSSPIIQIAKRKMVYDTNLYLTEILRNQNERSWINVIHCCSLVKHLTLFTESTELLLFWMSNTLGGCLCTHTFGQCSGPEMALCFQEISPPPPPFVCLLTQDPSLRAWDFLMYCLVGQ